MFKFQILKLPKKCLKSIRVLNKQQYTLKNQAMERTQLNDVTMSNRYQNYQRITWQGWYWIIKVNLI